MSAIVSFLLVLGLLVFIHELGHFVTAKRAGVKVEEFGFGFPPRLVAVRRGETEYSLNLIPLGGFVRMQGEDDPTEPRSFARAAKRWRSLILLAGPVMNLVLAVLLFAGAYAVGWPTPTRWEVHVMNVVAGSPAERAGVQPDDVIVRLGDSPIEDTATLQARTQELLGRPTTLVVRRGDAEHTLPITPNPSWEQGRGALGVTIQNRPSSFEPVAYPVGEALWQGLQRTADMVAFTLTVPVMIARGLLPAEVARPVGPYGIYEVTSQAAAQTVSTGWWFPILYVAAALSVGLGIANLLPIPGLDGGRLLFIAIEAIRGRRVSPQIEGLIHMVGVAVLLALVVVISYYDVTVPLPDLDFGVR